MLNLRLFGYPEAASCCRYHEGPGKEYLHLLLLGQFGAPPHNSALLACGLQATSLLRTEKGTERPPHGYAGHVETRQIGDRVAG